MFVRVPEIFFKKEICKKKHELLVPTASHWQKRIGIRSCFSEAYAKRKKIALYHTHNLVKFGNFEC